MEFVIDLGRAETWKAVFEAEGVEEVAVGLEEEV